jgi:hypothetical protein
MSILNLSDRRRYLTEKSKNINQLSRLMTKFNVGKSDKRPSGTQANDTSVQKHLDDMNEKRRAYLTYREDLKKKKRIYREKYEHKKKGTYRLLFPLVSE